MMDDELKRKLKSHVDFVENEMDYKGFFYQAAHRYFFNLLANQEIEEKEKECYRIIGLCCHMMLNNNDFQSPLKPAIILTDRISMHPELMADDMDKIKYLSTLFDDGYIKSRLCEVVIQGTRGENYKYIDSIILGYIKDDIKSDLWISCQKDNYERAFNLSKRYNKEDFSKEIERRLLKYIDENYTDESGFSLSAFNMVSSLGITLREEFNTVSSIEKYTLSLIEKGMLDRASYSYGILCGHFKKDNIKRSLYAIKRAKVQVLEAEEFLKSDKRMRNNFARDLFGKALVLLKSTNKESRDEESLELLRTLPSKIDESGKKSLEEMHSFEYETDITDLVESSLTHIGKSENVIDGLFRLSGFEYLKEDNIRKSLEDGPVSISRLLGSSKILSVDGRLIHTSNGHDGDHHDFSMATKNYIDLHVRGQILPCMNYLREKYFITRELIDDMCRQSDIIPDNMIHTFISAIHLGFDFKFHQAIYMICPLMELIVRNKLKSIGIDTQYRDVDQTSTENGLSTLIDLAEKNSAMPKDIIFTIDFMFCNSLGYNLRNESSHGLLIDDLSHSTASVYAWWILFRIVIRAASSAKDI